MAILTVRNRNVHLIDSIFTINIFDVLCDAGFRLVVEKRLSESNFLFRHQRDRWMAICRTFEHSVGIRYFGVDWDLTALKIHTSSITSFCQAAGDGEAFLKYQWSADKKSALPFFVVPPSLKHYANPDLYKEIVLQCLNNDIKPFIASFGSRMAIKNYIELLFGEEQTIFNDDNVFTPSTIGEFDFTGLSDKQAFLDTISQNTPLSVAFYDDSSSIISIALEQGYKFATFVPHCLYDKKSYLFNVK